MTKVNQKSFPSKYIVEIDTYLTKNGIKNATVTLNEDIPAEDFTSPLVVPVDTTFILDLNGHKLETTAAASAIQYQGKGVELTIQDSSSGKTGDFRRQSSCRRCVIVSGGNGDRPNGNQHHRRNAENKWQQL